MALSDFLQEVALLTDLDSEGDEDQPKVSLMTIHSAKGLEFPTVFVVGLEENIFPSPLCVNSMRELEEERRLLYVAITRAEKHCILTCAQNRFRYGRMEYDTPSRFIRDIDPQLLTVVGQMEGGSSFGTNERKPWQRPSEGPEWMQNPRPVATQFRADPKPRQVAPRRPEAAPDPFSDAFKRQLNIASNGRFKPVPKSAPAAASQPSSSTALHEGAVIEHQRFGIGTIVKLEGSGDNEKATVEFRNVGTKQLLLKFAKFNVLK